MLSHQRNCKHDNKEHVGILDLILCKRLNFKTIENIPRVILSQSNCTKSETNTVQVGWQWGSVRDSDRVGDRLGFRAARCRRP